MTDWACPRCTLHNESGARECSVCGATLEWLERMESEKAACLARWTELFGPRIVAVLRPCVFSHQSDTGNEILPGLFLGGGRAANPAWLAERDVTVVINAAEEVRTSLPADSQVRLHRLGVSDVPADADALAELAPRAVEIIAAARAESRNILVHCAVGASRSATLVLAFLITPVPAGGGMTLVEALELVKARRPVVYPNKGFLRALGRLEGEWRGERSLSEEAVVEMHEDGAPWLR